MAGLGRKIFAAGEVLTAANVQSYLQDQVVMVFDDATDRSTTLGTAASEGMVAYTKDDNAIQYYDGAAWNSVSISSLPGSAITGEITTATINQTNVAATLASSTATTYTIASSDQGTYLQFTNAATVTVSTATAFTAGQQVQIFADGTALSIVGSGVTLAGAGTAGTAVTFSVGGQYEAVAIVGMGSDSYRIIGNVTGV